MASAYSPFYAKLVVLKKASQAIGAPLKSILYIVLEFSILGINKKNYAEECNGSQGEK